MRKAFRNGYETLERNDKLPQFLILVFFLLTWAVVRIGTHLQRAHVLPNQHGALHIHHMVFGILMLLITGYVGLSFANHSRLLVWMAVLFGIGAALTVDEFALWLFLKDVYWAKQGRASVDAAVGVATALSATFVLSQAYDHVLFKRSFARLRGSRPNASIEKRSSSR